MMTLAQKRMLFKSLPKSKRDGVKKICQECQMKGEGIKEILTKIRALLGAAARQVGPVVLKEVIVPFLIKKGKEQAGVGISLAGAGLSPAGGALRLAGQGRSTTSVARTKAPSKWIQHVKSVAKDKGISFKEAMKVAKATYKK